MAQNLADAVKRGSSSQLERALQLHGAAINGLTASEQTALHVAVWQGNPAILQQLIDAGADVSRRDGESGWTPLHKALYQGTFAVAALLLRAGATADVTDPKGRAPVDLVSQELQPFLLAAAASSSSLGQQAVRQQVCRQAAPVELPPGSSKSQLFSWGNGANFQLGTGSTDVHLLPVRVDFSAVHSALPAADTATPSSTDAAAAPAGGTSSSSSTGGARPLQEQPPPPERLVAVAAAKFHSCAVSDTGQVYTWGFGRGGRLGHPEFEVHSGSSAVILPRLVTGLGRRKVVCVSAAKHHTLVATSAGEVYSWGSNKDGRLGYPAVDNQPHPRKVALLRVRATCVAAANKHSVVITASGEVYTWGGNALGQLGYGTSDCTSNPTPRLVEAMKGRRLVGVAAAKRHTVVLTAEGEVYTWGHKLVTPRKVSLAGSRDTARAAAAATSSGAAVSGANDAPGAAAASSGGAGGAGAGASTAASSAAASSSSSSGAGLVGGEVRFHQGQSEVLRPVAVAVAAGAAHTTCLTRTGVVLTWRSEQLQPVVQEVLGPQGGQTAVAVSAGKMRTAVVTARGDVYMWEGTPVTSDQLQQPLASLSPAPAGTAAVSSGSSGAGGSSGRGAAGLDGRPSLQGSVGEAEASGVSSSAAGGGTGGAGVPGVVPVLVPGIRKVAQLAVGEKHSLAIQALWCPVIPEDSQQHSSMIRPPHHKNAPGGAASAAAGDGLQWGQRLQQDSLEYTAAADAIAAGHGSGSDSDQDAAASSSSSRQPPTQPPPPQQQQEVCPSGTSSSGHWGLQEQVEASDAGTNSAVESLQLICQRVVASQLVDPRTALPILEYAAMAGAELLCSYCLGVAVGNLDVVLQEARHSFEGLSQQLLLELEKVYAALVLSHSSTSSRRGMQWRERATPQQQQQYQQHAGHFYPHLQPGKRPTAAAPAHDASPAAAPGAARSVLSVAVQALDAVRQLPDHLLPVPRAPTFRSNSDATQDELQREAAAKLTRTCVKKLQQIDSLEQRQAAGDPLDEQQRAKLSLKSAWQHALRRLEAGWPAAEVAGVMVKAQEEAGLSSASMPALATPPPAAATAAGAAPAAAIAPHAASAGSSDAASTTPEAAGAAATVSPGGADPAHGSSSSRKGARQASKRAGGLSMFLKGALDTPPPAPTPAPAATPSTSGSKEPGAPKAPAWGGARPTLPAPTPLGEASARKQLLAGSPGGVATGSSSSSNRAAVSIGTGAAPAAAAAGGNLPPAPTAAGGPGRPMGSAALAPAMAPKSGPSTTTTSSSSSTLPVARQLSHSSGLLGSSPGSSSGWLGGAAAPVYGSSPPAAGPLRTPGRSSGVGTSATSRPASGARLDSSGGVDGPSGSQVTLFDVLQQQRKTAKAAAAAKAAESSKAEPSGPPPPAWGGVSLAAAAAGGTAAAGTTAAAAAAGGDRVLGTSPAGVSTPAVKSLKEIQAEQEQVRATSGLAALQRERAAAAAAGKLPGGSSPLPQPGTRHSTGAPAAVGASSSSSIPIGQQRLSSSGTSSTSAAAGGMSLQVQQLRAAGGLTAALAQSPGLLGRSPSNSAAVLGSSPSSLGRAGSWRLTGSSSGRPGGGGPGGSSSSYVLGSSPSAPSKWYTGDLPQVRPLTSIQLEQQEAALQQQLAAEKEEEERIANELIAAAEARERAAAKAAARKAARAAAQQAAKAAADAMAGPPAADGTPATPAPAAEGGGRRRHREGRGTDAATTSTEAAGASDRGRGSSGHRRHGRGGRASRPEGPTPAAAGEGPVGAVGGGVTEAGPGSAAGGLPPGSRRGRGRGHGRGEGREDHGGHGGGSSSSRGRGQAGRGGRRSPRDQPTQQQPRPPPPPPQQQQPAPAATQ